MYNKKKNMMMLDNLKKKNKKIEKVLLIQSDKNRNAILLRYIRFVREQHKQLFMLWRSKLSQWAQEDLHYKFKLATFQRPRGYSLISLEG